MTSPLTIIKGPHLLYTGANGLKTFGITVKNNNWSVGYLKEFDLNDNTLLNVNEDHLCERLGISRDEVKKLRNEIEDLLLENKND